MISRYSNPNPTKIKPEFYRPQHGALDIQHFICYMGDGWYVETRQSEYGPFQSLRDAEDFCENRFRVVASRRHEQCN